MKLGTLEAKIRVLEERVLQLERYEAMHHTSRPPEWKSNGLKEELEQARDRLKELRAWLKGGWYE